MGLFSRFEFDIFDMFYSYIKNNHIINPFISQLRTPYQSSIFSFLILLMR